LSNIKIKKSNNGGNKKLGPQVGYNSLMLLCIKTVAFQWYENCKGRNKGDAFSKHRVKH